MERGAGEDRCSTGAHCPRVSVVMGCVIDFGESSRELAGPRGDIPFEEVIKTTYPHLGVTLHDPHDGAQRDATQSQFRSARAAGADPPQRGGHRHRQRLALRGRAAGS
ncbi:hypothetical protein MASR1M6_38070 [Rubrivivax sp.]